MVFTTVKFQNMLISMLPAYGPLDSSVTVASDADRMLRSTAAPQLHGTNIDQQDFAVAAPNLWHALRPLSACVTDWFKRQLQTHLLTVVLKFNC